MQLRNCEAVYLVIGPKAHQLNVHVGEVILASGTVAKYETEEKVIYLHDFKPAQR